MAKIKGNEGAGGKMYSPTPSFPNLPPLKMAPDSIALKILFNKHYFAIHLI
jgi:hypothetical protein